MVIRRGEVWWASLAEPTGSEPGYRRPLVVMQSNDFNASGIRTVLSVPATSNVRLAAAPGNVLLPRRASGLPRDCVANVSQVFPVDRAFFTRRVGVLSQELLARVEEGLRLILRL